MRNKIPMALVVIMMLALVVFGSFMPSVMHVNGAVITPVSNNNSNGGARFAVFFSGTPIAADTRSCIDLGAYDVLDIQTVINPSGVNTTSLKHQYSNNNANYTDANTLILPTPVTANTPVAAMSQQALFGRYTCMFADVANATPVSLYVSGVAK